MTMMDNITAFTRASMDITKCNNLQSCKHMKYKESYKLPLQ